MSKVTFITGNQDKADFLAKFIGIDIKHKKIELDEIQSLDLHKITEHKARQAYEELKAPVLVEDVSLSINALGRLPGPFIRWFLEELGNEAICHLLDGFDDRSAKAEITYAYFDGQKLEFFDGAVNGKIADRPKGSGGFGWNPIFIPVGASKTYAEMDEKETRQFSLRTIKVYPELKLFLESVDKK